MGKNGKDLRAAQKNLAALLAQFEDLSESRKKLERELSTLVAASPEGILRLQALQQDLAVVLSSETATEIAIAEAEKVLHVARAWDAEEKLEELRKREEPLVRDVVQGLISLRDRTHVLGDFHVQLASLGAAPWMGPPAILIQAIQASEAFYTTYFPHLLDLPARPTHIEETQQNAIADCERSLFCFGQVEDLLKGSLARSVAREKRALEVRRDQIVDDYVRFASRCRELGCEVPGSPAMSAARSRRAKENLAGVEAERRQRERYHPVEEILGAGDGAEGRE